MSYAGRVHDALWQLLDDSYGEVDWKVRSAMVDDIIGSVLPIFEREVELRGAKQAADRLVSVMVPPASHD